MKKAIGAATSAALVASLLATAVAPAALADITIPTSAGAVPQGATSAGSATFLFTELTAAAIPNAASSLTVTITDFANAATVSFVGTPVVSATGSLGATASVGGASNVLTVSWTASDPGSIESISVSGLKIKATAAASPGAIRATLGGNFAPFFTAPATVLATGTIQATNELTTVAGDTADILVSSVCPFAPTGGTNSNASFSDVSDSRLVTAAGAVVAGIQSVTFGAGINNHAAGVVVTQTVTNCAATVLPSSPGIVARALAFTSGANLNLFAGESNGPGSNLTLSEPAAGFLVSGTVVTLTIKTAGVLFSTRPIVSTTVGNAVIAGGSANEVQTVTLAGGAVGDTFTLSFTNPALVTSTTAAIPFNETAANVQTALTGLASVGAGNATVTGVAGGPYTVTFIGALGVKNVSALVATATDAAPVGPFTATVATATQGGNAAGVTLSADRASASFTVSTASTIASTIVISNILYDVASTVPGGTFVDVQVTLSGGLLVTPTDNTNAVVGRGLTATATPTTVFIGQNAQKTGLTTITELQPGFFQGGTGTNNVIEVCLLNNREAFTSPGPWAKVTTTGTGALVLREGDVASPDNIVLGTPVFVATTGDTCYMWKVWTASTVVSAIQIGNSDFTSGPLVDVPADSVPGAVNMSIILGNGDVIPQAAPVSATVQIATAVFQNSVAVTALSQPLIPAGSTNALAGNIQIAETAIGQLKLNEDICVEVLPRTSNEAIQDTFLKGVDTADLPVATTSGGVLVGPVAESRQSCSDIENNVPLTPSDTHIVSFSFPIQQQSLDATGKVVISNIHYIVVADAPSGNVLVNVFGFGNFPTDVEFQATVSNAKIGVPPVLPKISIGAVSALGLRPTTGYTTRSPKTQKVGKFVTWKFTGGTALAGQRVNILVATKISGAWGGPKYFVSRVADANGIVTFWWKFNSAKGINVRVQWPGDAAHSVSTSVARGAYWK